VDRDGLVLTSQEHPFQPSGLLFGVASASMLRQPLARFLRLGGAAVEELYAGERTGRKGALKSSSGAPKKVSARGEGHAPGGASDDPPGAGQARACAPGRWVVGAQGAERSHGLAVRRSAGREAEATCGALQVGPPRTLLGYHADGEPLPLSVQLVRKAGAAGRSYAVLHLREPVRGSRSFLEHLERGPMDPMEQAAAAEAAAAAASAAAAEAAAAAVAAASAAAAAAAVPRVVSVLAVAGGEAMAVGTLAGALPLTAPVSGESTVALDGPSASSAESPRGERPGALLRFPDPRAPSMGDRGGGEAAQASPRMRGEKGGAGVAVLPKLAALRGALGSGSDGSTGDMPAVSTPPLKSDAGGSASPSGSADGGAAGARSRAALEAEAEERGSRRVVVSPPVDVSARG
jgi:hypothetical protein